MTVAAPMIHLNGSGKETLRANWRDAYEALAASLEAVARTAPHMRDYYPMENADEVYRLAREDHERRMNDIQKMLREFEELYHSTLS